MSRVERARGAAERHWWAPSRRRARVTAAGAIAIVVALSGTSAAIWLSPEGSPVGEVVDAMTHTDELIEQRSHLLSDIVDLKNELARREAQLDTARTDLAGNLAAVRRLQAVLDDAQAQVAALEAQDGDATAPGGSSSASGDRSATEPITAPPRDELADPARPYFGMYTEQAPFNWATFDATATKVGSVPTAVGYFCGWDEAFRAKAVTRSWQRGILPIMTWESRPIAAPNSQSTAPEYSLPRILGGAFDDYLRDYARDIVATGLPLGIRLDHEMNGTWYPWSETGWDGAPLNGNNRGDYVKMWRHVHDIFEQEGANRLVIWIWAPNRIDNLKAASRTPGFLANYYPGDEYVDWVGMSGYLRPPANGTQNFDVTYGATLKQLRALTDKPILLAEVGATEIGGQKPAWVRSFFRGLNSPANADIVGFSWFSLAITTYIEGERGTNDWRIDSRGDSLAAFRDGLLAPGSRFG